MALSEKKRVSNANWDKDNMKRMSLALRIDEYDRLKKHIQQTGENANSFIRRAIAHTIKTDNEAASRADQDGE